MHRNTDRASSRQMTSNESKTESKKSPQQEKGGDERGVLLSVYLAGSSVKAFGQEFQLSDGSDLRGHLNHPHQLFAV